MKKILNKKCLIISISIIIIVIITAVTIGFVQYIYPQNCISNINDNYDSQRYDKVIKYKSNLNLIMNYLKNDNEYKNIEAKLKISEAIVEIGHRNFRVALLVLCSIQDEEESNETINNKINQLIDDIHFNLAIESLENKNYQQAKEEIEQIKNDDYNKLEETKNNICYEYAKQCFNQENYTDAITKFESLGNYKNAEEYTKKAYVKEAENCIDNGDYKEAMTIYNYLPTNFKYNGIKVSTRRKQLNKIKNVLKLAGKKEATKSYCETRNVWKYDGRWENWYINEPSPLEYIDLDLKLNDDGTFNLYGEVNFNAFDDFSSLKEYCNAKIISKSIEMENIKKIPSTYKIDNHTKLFYSNGKFTLKYSEKDDYSTNFYNLYTSTVTY